jgi:hypothetical protein
MFKAFKPREWIIINFFKRFFSSTKCSPFLLKIGKDFNIDDYKYKRIGINESYSNNQFEHIWFKHAFDLENYGF